MRVLIAALVPCALAASAQAGSKGGVSGSTDAPSAQAGKAAAAHRR